MEETKSVSGGSLELQNTNTQYQQYVDAMQRMNFVVATMREDQSAPAGQTPTDDASIITHVVFPPTGGILTYLARYEYPFRGFPYNDTVQSIDELKKLAKIIVQEFLPYAKKTSLLGKLRLVLSIDHLTKLAECYLHAYYWHVKRYRLKPNMYSQSVRELWQVIDKSGDVITKVETKEAIRDIVCMFLEFDNAYRYRVQDVLVELDKNALKKDSEKEILRLIDLLIGREVHEEGQVKMVDKWRMSKELLKFYFRFNKKAIKAIGSILERLNLKEIEFSIEDRYYCEFRKDYKFGFMTREKLPIREVPKGSPLQVDKTLTV